MFRSDFLSEPLFLRLSASLLVGFQMGVRISFPWFEKFLTKKATSIYTKGSGLFSNIMTSPENEPGF